MKTIHKFPIEIVDFQVINIPSGAKFLHVDMQNQTMCLWALVDTDAPIVERRIRVIGTGLPAGDISIEQHIGSVLVLQGTYVFHIFDVGVSIQ